MIICRDQVLREFKQISEVNRITQHDNTSEKLDWTNFDKVESK